MFAPPRQPQFKKQLRLSPWRVAVVFALAEIKALKDQFRHINMMQHENSATRYDILFYAGDWSEITLSEPNFKFEDVNVLDLNLTGSEMPDNLAMEQNLHITAAVEEYDEASANKEQKPNSSLEIMRNSAFLFSTSQYAAEQQAFIPTDN